MIKGESLMTVPVRISFHWNAFRAALGCAVLIALMATGLVAQAGSGTITGRVLDPQGLPVAGASVSVRATDTDARNLLVTNNAGIYQAFFLQPGAYEISVSRSGFANLLRKDVTLQVGQTLTIDLELSLKATQTEVTVTGEPPVVDMEKTDVSQVVSQSEKDNLPMAGRNWQQFVFTTPNVTNDGGTGLFSARGISGLYNSSNVDGTNNNQAFFSESKGRTTLPYVYSMDSIQEYQVATSNYSAEMGQAAGAVINAVTKSGGNDLHGDLFYFLRYPTWNALDSYGKSRIGSAAILTQPIHQQQQFGGSFSGPIIKDKLFYFLTYDGSRKVDPIAYTSSATYPQACPAPSTASAAAVAALATACTNANGFVSSTLGSFARFQNQDIAFGKLDYVLNATNRLNASFNFDNFRGPNSYNTAVTANNSGVTQNGKAVTHERNFVAQWSSILSPTMVNNLRFQWSRDLEIIAANYTAPSVSITNFTAYGMPNALPRPAFPDEHRMQFSDTLEKVHGTHTIKVGYDFNIIHELLINLFQGGGVYSYSGASAWTQWVADVSGINLGDGLTGRHWATFVQVNDPVTHVGKDDFHNNDYAFFVEDTWKVRPNLTLNLGLRYDVSTIPQPPDPNLATPLTKLYTSTINIPKDQFGPRLGAAWNIAHGTVLRVGYGLFFAKTSNSQYYATRVENGVIQQTFNCTPSTCPALNFPNVIFTPPGGTPVAPFAGALVPQVTTFTPPALTQTARGQVPDFVNPRVHEGDVTVEHEFYHTSLSASYIFSRGLHLPVFIDANIAPSTSTRSYDVLSTTGAQLSQIANVPFYTSRIDPTGPILTAHSDANSWYNSFVLTARRPMAHGLEMVLNYTLSKAVDTGEIQGNSGTFNGGGTNFPVDPYNRSLEKARSDLDQRHRVSASMVYVPEWGKKVSEPHLQFLVSGWTFSSIVTANAGQPLTGTINGASPPGATPAGPGGIDGGLTGGSNNNSGTALNGARPYNEQRNAYQGPGLAQVDFRVARSFTYKEKYKLTMMGEAFNLFNFMNFYSFNATEYNYTALGSGSCTAALGHVNNCLVQNISPTGFLTGTSTSNNLSGARQLQISLRFSF
jgi:outer membrane receptor protein involved in Fe transport